MFPPPAQQQNPSSRAGAAKGILGTFALAGVIGGLLYVAMPAWFQRQPKEPPKPPPAVKEQKAAVKPDPEPDPLPPTPAPKPRVVALPPPPGSILTARLQSAIGTKTSFEGERFSARVEGGPYAGGTLSGRVAQVERKRKESRLSLEFDALTYNGVRYPLVGDLRGIANSSGKRGVDESGVAFNTAPSKKRVALLSAVGAAAGGVIGKIKGGSKTATAVGAAAGAGAGVAAGYTLASHAADLQLGPGTMITIAVAQ